MKIRTLDQDFNNNQLEISWGGNGDVYVTIYVNEDEFRNYPVIVRVGMGGSGMHLPGNIGKLFAELATEFEKYKDSKFESDAYLKEFNQKF